ncbi:hypothetical protein [Gordonia sihwensis]|uniref:hypothetical protein n=1 Tax=Gordonia sihwensis TaxID=173559 RepID=UPI003D953E9F
MSDHTDIVMPDDAGEHASGLADILHRIPHQWGRWIRVRKGWYPLIIELDQALAAIDPHYEVHQAKEKFGELRFYYAPSDCATNPQAMSDLVTAAEQRSTQICEVCGATGPDVHLNSKDRFYIQTLCMTCAARRDQTASSVDGEPEERKDGEVD